MTSHWWYEDKQEVMLCGRGQTLIQRWAKAMQALASVVSYLSNQKQSPPHTENQLH